MHSPHVQMYKLQAALYEGRIAGCRQKTSAVKDRRTSNFFTAPHGRGVDSDEEIDGSPTQLFKGGTCSSLAMAAKN